MKGRAIDLLAAGPAPSDPYDPAAPAWALAAGIASWGDRVRVLHPTGPSTAPLPEGVESLPIDLPLRRPGAAVEEAALATAAGRRLRPEAEMVVRDPIGLGPVLAGRRRQEPPVVGVVRGVELTAYDGEATHQHPSGLRGRVETWRDRRAVRRLEREALAEADRLFYDDPEVVALLTREYSVDPRRLASAPAPVRSGPSISREEARRALRLPLDVPVVAAPLCCDDPASPEALRVEEAFHRVRSLFAGARLVVVGAAISRTEPGATWVADRDRASFERAFAAADVAVVAPSSPRFDAGAVLALHAGCPVLASPTVVFPVAPERAVRYGASTEPADLAVSLAELLADPEQRHRLANQGRRFAERFEPERVAATVTAETRLLAA